MKNFTISVIITVALIALVSCIDYRRTEETSGFGFGTQRKGDSGLTLPGDGDQMAEVNFAIPEQTVAYNLSPTADKAEAVTATEELKEEHKKMDGLIIAFWHGVGAVLVGEASALLVACAWMKIRGDRNV